MGNFKKLLRLPNFHFKTNLGLIRRLPFCVLFAFLLGQENSPGLRFYNKYGLGKISEFSYLDISTNDPIAVENEFTLSFQFLIREPNPFGFIFHINGDSLPSSKMTYIDFKQVDTSYFEFSIDGMDEAISFPIAKSELTAFNWHHLSVTYNFVYDEVRIVLNNNHVNVLKYPMLNEQNIKIR
ncbi:MAG: hypothetical protein ISR82_01125 [Candidatus Marinimicrobia bacterium]|nr:hypothetical protein [Candidatus Neomarinimicrobiota bacterium]MBL7009808.1 hypothetical protein [Candidatus Neomarinimicrobiota bacterium]MBL7029788.1 hypothetical protein [Candidatus Neomarinimicrobiota bacterium]